MTALPGVVGQVVEDLAEPVDVVVPEPLHRGTRELGAGDQRVVGVLVEHDVVVTAEEAADGADVGDVAGGEHQRRLTAVEVGQLVLEGAVEVEGAVQEAGAGDAGAVSPGGHLGGLDHLRVVREAQVVVRAEVDVVLTLDGEPGPSTRSPPSCSTASSRQPSPGGSRRVGGTPRGGRGRSSPDLTPTFPSPPASGQRTGRVGSLRGTRALRGECSRFRCQQWAGQAPGLRAGQAPGLRAGQAPGLRAGQAPGLRAGQPGAEGVLEDLLGPLEGVARRPGRPRCARRTSTGGSWCGGGRGRWWGSRGR